MGHKLYIHYGHNYVTKQKDKDGKGKLQNTNLGYPEGMGIQVIYFYLFYFPLFSTVIVH